MGPTLTILYRGSAANAVAASAKTSVVKERIRLGTEPAAAKGWCVNADCMRTSCVAFRGLFQVAPVLQTRKKIYQITTDLRIKIGCIACHNRPLNRFATAVH